MTNDPTNTTRQQRRRLREKEWLAQNGWSSWESLHTSLMNGTASLVPDPKNTPPPPIMPAEPPRDPKKTIKYQWKRNMEAGQSVGNRQEIRPLTEGGFHRFIRSTLDPGIARNLPEYQSRYPGNTHYSVVWGEEDTDWRLTGVGAQEELLSEPRNSPWAIEVEDFNTQKAINQGRMPDREDITP